MNKLDFISELTKKTGLSQSDGEKVNEVLEGNNLLANAGEQGYRIGSVVARGSDDVELA